MGKILDAVLDYKRGLPLAARLAAVAAARAIGTIADSGNGDTLLALISHST